ncbi:MAG: hypothetical protein WCC48_10000 [Anaeromyxobacteraceae bacterium]
MQHMVMVKIDDEQRVRYRVAVEAMAAWVVSRLGDRDVEDEDFMETALAELRRMETAERSEHLWIFRDPLVLHASDSVFEALDERSGGQRDWFHADLTSAVAAVARYDVMSSVGEWIATIGPEDGDGSARVSIS